MFCGILDACFCWNHVMYVKADIQKKFPQNSLKIRIQNLLISDIVPNYCGTDRDEPEHVRILHFNNLIYFKIQMICPDGYGQKR